MKRKYFWSIIVPVIFASCSVSNKAEKDTDILSYVNPLIGTDFHGHTFPGACVPFGMVQLSPDTRTEGWDACGGYHYSDSSIIGFSHTHLSGTGIGDYGDVLMMPFVGNPAMDKGSPEDPDSGYRSRYSKENQEASPGYYKVLLDDYNILAEFSTTSRAGIHQYTFPEASDAGIIIDLTHTIHEHKNPGGVIRIINEYEIEGLKQTQGWATNHYAYFYAKFSKPFKYELYKDNEVVEASEISGGHLKAKISFNTQADEKVLVKVGISGVDFEGAKKNVNAEISDWDFDTVLADAQELWGNQINKIIVNGSTEENKRVFYTALYHINISPTIYSDVDGRYRGMDQEIQSSETPNYTVFSLWDTYRALHPLFTIIKPDYNQELIKSLLRKYQEGGILPMWELASNYTGTMIGSHAVSVIVDAYMKGYRDFDTELALEAVIQAMEYDTVKSINYPHDGVKNSMMPKGKLYDVQYGYIPSDLENSSVSRGLEFAYNNWCVAEMAKDMGRLDIAEKFYERSEHYKAYFNSETGFMRGRLQDGSWKTPFDPRFSSHWKTPYVEGNAWQWTWFVPHDIDGLIELFEGKEKFAEKLDSLFTTTSEITGAEASVDITGLIGQYAHGNEPGHHTAYLYDYADQAWKTQEIVSKIVNDFYTDQPDGLCGNEDCGQMSAWYIFSAMGFYPVCPGSSQYVIGTPLFTKVEIPLTNGKTFVVNAPNVSAENIYIQSATLNGKELNQAWFSHDEIKEGGVLELVMGAKANKDWGVN